MFIRKSLFALLILVMATIAGAAALKEGQTGAEMTKAAGGFLAGLSEEQRAKAGMNYEDPKRVDWHFIPKPQRKGLQIKEMKDADRKRAHALLKSGLSQIGYDKATLIMRLEAILRELEKSKKDSPLRDTERYYFTVFGTPATEGSWGWSVEGHHLSLNFAVKDGKVLSTTPTVLGANPAIVKDDGGVGIKKGARVLEKEETLAFELVNSLSDEQRKVAILADTAPKDVRGAGEAQAPKEPAKGLSASKMTDAQLKLLQGLIDVYAANMPAEVAAARLAGVKKAGLKQVTFRWEGATKPGVGHYYVIEGPTFIIEFVNTQPDASGNIANHIHSFWRDQAGDFGLPR